MACQSNSWPCGISNQNSIPKKHTNNHFSLGHYWIIGRVSVCETTVGNMCRSIVTSMNMNMLLFALHCQFKYERFLDSWMLFIQLKNLQSNFCTCPEFNNSIVQSLFQHFHFIKGYSYSASVSDPHLTCLECFVGIPVECQSVHFSKTNPSN